MTALSPRCSFSGTALKTIACITMLVDHIGASCIEAGILTLPELDIGTRLAATPWYPPIRCTGWTGSCASPGGWPFLSSVFCWWRALYIPTM